MCRTGTARLITAILLASTAVIALSGATAAQNDPQDPVIFWYELENGIWRAAPESDPVAVVPAAEDLLFLGMDVATDTDEVYWLQYHPDELETIRRVDLDGGGHALVVGYAGCGLSSVAGTVVAGDWIYWTVHSTCGGGGTGLMRAPRHGAFIGEVLITSPWYVVDFDLDADNGYVYWTSLHETTDEEAIVRATLDGDDVEILVAEVQHLTGIALDTDNNHVYWGEDERIMRVDTDGQNVTEILDTDSLVVDIEIDAENEKIYWSDTDRLVWRANLDGSAVEPFYQLPPAAVGFELHPQKVTAAEGSTAPVLALEQSYPNPAVGSAVIRFVLDAQAEVRLEVFDVLGRQVATLASGVHAAGPHEVVLDADRLPAGTYIYRLSTGEQSVQRTMTVIGR